MVGSSVKMETTLFQEINIFFLMTLKNKNNGINSLDLSNELFIII